MQSEDMDGTKGLKAENLIVEGEGDCGDDDGIKDDACLGKLTPCPCRPIAARETFIALANKEPRRYQLVDELFVAVKLDTWCKELGGDVTKANLFFERTLCARNHTYTGDEDDLTEEEAAMVVDRATHMQFQ